MYVTFLFKFLRNVKYEEALEKFESVLGTKLEPNEAAVAGNNVACCYSQAGSVFVGLFVTYLIPLILTSF